MAKCAKKIVVPPLVLIQIFKKWRRPQRTVWHVLRPVANLENVQFKIQFIISSCNSSLKNFESDKPWGLRIVNWKWINIYIWEWQTLSSALKRRLGGQLTFAACKSFVWVVGEIFWALDTIKMFGICYFLNQLSSPRFLLRCHCCKSHSCHNPLGCRRSPRHVSVYQLIVPTFHFQ